MYSPGANLSQGNYFQVQPLGLTALRAMALGPLGLQFPDKLKFASPKALMPEQAILNT